MTKEEFLRWAEGHTPWTQSPIAAIPNDWRDELEQVWHRHYDWLDNVLRSVSKIGRIWVPQGALREYLRSLTVEEQVAVFLRIRGYCPWREPEFRTDFESGFPECVAALPPPLSEQERQRLWDAVVRNSIPGEDIPY